VIKTFRSAETERLFLLHRSRKFRTIERAALRRLVMLDAAPDLATLAAIPGNRLERLHGDRAKHYSIRINDQWRICFEWKVEDAYEVEIIDYH
jgi:proteic killer suppression protein